jgi:transposase
VRYNDWSRETYERIHGGQKTRRKKAAIALARKIAVVAWAMLKNKTDWDPEKAGIRIPTTVQECPSSKGPL